MAKLRMVVRYPALVGMVLPISLLHASVGAGTYRSCGGKFITVGSLPLQPLAAGNDDSY